MQVVRLPYEEWAENHIACIKGMLDGVRTGHMQVMKDRIDEVGQMKDVVSLTEGLIAISKVSNPRARVPPHSSIRHLGLEASSCRLNLEASSHHLDLEEIVCSRPHKSHDDDGYNDDSGDDNEHDGKNNCENGFLDHKNELFKREKKSKREKARSRE
jgi:hypothetical protein